ncbi:hypothetical protein V5D56_16050 [Cellulosimicrobium sp. PMB13]|uniref:hypothetical protein n=1 Tax=Cellulosimicrobium sp. PMB13 TaxID=3120158 RepID=UPI003F4C4595
MGAPHALELRVVTVDGVVEVVPYVDGRSLVALARDLESSAGYSPAGAYGGLVPEHFRYGPAAQHWYGRGRVPAPGHAWILACDCHEAGCWPLEATIAVDEDTVTWSGFSQPHQPRWDYGRLGPFAFDRAQYDDAVDRVSHLFV